jgi:hypothetical protein
MNVRGIIFGPLILSLIKKAGGLNDLLFFFISHEDDFSSFRRCRSYLLAADRRAPGTKGVV